MTKYHFFDIGEEQFSCEVDFDFKNRHLWYSNNNNECLFMIDRAKGFRTKEACEKYIKTRVKAVCKKLLKGLE